MAQQRYTEPDSVNLINKNGIIKYYTNIPDLWYLNALPGLSAAQKKNILEVWHMAHDFRDVLKNNGDAKLIGAEK